MRRLSDGYEEISGQAQYYRPDPIPPVLFPDEKEAPAAQICEARGTDPPFEAGTQPSDRGADAGDPAVHSLRTGEESLSFKRTSKEVLFSYSEQKLEKNLPQ